MKEIIKFLQQIYALLAQVHEITKANNLFAQSFETRLTNIENSFKFDLPDDMEIPAISATEDVASSNATASTVEGEEKEIPRI